MVKNKEVEVKVLSTNSHWFGVTYLEDKPHVIKELNNLINEENKELESIESNKDVFRLR